MHRAVSDAPFVPSIYWPDPPLNTPFAALAEMLALGAGGRALTQAKASRRAFRSAAPFMVADAVPVAVTPVGPSMMCYASRTGTKRNLDALRRHGWGLLVSRAGVWRTEGFDHVCGDNGAWADFQAGRSFDEDAYGRFLGWIEVQDIMPDWLVLPDIVAGGLRSLELSLRYMNRCLSVAPLVLIAVQDGMEHDDLAPLVGPSVGIFLGGTTEWKLARMADWGAFCRERGIHYHVARVNSSKRMFRAIAAGADSIDGSSASRYAVTTAKLTYASRHLDLFAGAA